MVDHLERTVPVRDGKLQISVLEGGQGEPLVFIHGAGPSPGWDPFLDQLANEFRVYAPYHPGVGESYGLEHLDDLWDLVLFYEELIDALGLQSTFLVGHSYGGMIAAELAAQCPQRIRRLALVSSLGLWLDDTPVTDFFVLLPEEQAKLVWYDPNSDVAKASLAQPEDPQAKAEADLERTKTLSSIGKFIWPIPDRGLRKRIHRITSPTLLLWGAADGIVPPVYAEEYQRLIPGSQLAVIDKCGHIPQLECPERFHSELARFFTGG